MWLCARAGLLVVWSCGCWVVGLCASLCVCLCCCMFVCLFARSLVSLIEYVFVCLCMSCMHLCLCGLVFVCLFVCVVCLFLCLFARVSLFIDYVFVQ